MNISVVIFEDHTRKNFLPLAASQPVYELPVGAFNLRERVELVSGPGVLLCRALLAPLHTCGDWEINPEALAGDGPQLWLSGRARFTMQEFRAFVGDLQGQSDFMVVDKHGPLAIWSTGAEGSRLLDSWRTWDLGQGDTQTPSPWDPPAVGKVGDIPLKALGHIFDIVPATAETLAADAAYLSSAPGPVRRPFGVFHGSDDSPAPWSTPGNLVALEDHPDKPDSWSRAGGTVLLAADACLAPSVSIDASAGPVIIDRGVEVMPFCYLEGPLYLGPLTRVKAGATIYGESSFGIGNRLAGEIGESTFLHFANKQHDGFIGHAVLGSWTNLGAMTTCSDLKNNYGNVRVDLGFGTVDTGQRFVGLMMGDHAKTAIGTLFNTGTAVGFASNIFGTGMPPKTVPPYSWGGQADAPDYSVDRAMETAEVVMSRRACRMIEAHRTLMKNLAGT